MKVFLLASTVLMCLCTTSCGGSSGSPSGTGGQAGSSEATGGQGAPGGTGAGGGVSGGGTGGRGSTGGAAGASSGGSGGANGEGGTGGRGSTGGAAGAGSGGSGGANGGGGSTSSASVCPPGPYASSPLPSPVPTPQMVCSGFSFIEGPVWFSTLNGLLFSNFRSNEAASNFNGDVVRYTPGGSCEVFIADVGSNGLAIAPDGQLLAAVHVTQTLTSIDLMTKSKTVLIPDYMGKHFSSPNDLAVHDNGTIYFTDPNYQLGNRTMELAEAAYRRDSGGNVTIIGTLTRPNGIALSPDQARLYIAVSGGTRVYDLDRAGVPTNGRMFVTTGSDGMAVDCAGNLYLTSGGVQVFNPEGTRLGTISVQGSVTNVAFGGADRKTLFITGGARLLSVSLVIPGYPY